jgi:hypothetical protein
MFRRFVFKHDNMYQRIATFGITNTNVTCVWASVLLMSAHNIPDNNDISGIRMPDVVSTSMMFFQGTAVPH